MKEKNNASAAFNANGPRKVRAARAWLKWNVRETGEKAGIPHQYITYYETERLGLQPVDLNKLYVAFLKHGLKITESGLEAVKPNSNEV